MMYKAEYIKNVLQFNQAGGTSRGVLYTKPSWFIKISNNKGDFGIGECSIIPKLSIDDVPELEDKIAEVCENINDYSSNYHSRLKAYPALCFALEIAFKGIQNQSPYILFPSLFTANKKSIIINGLIWMGDTDEMLKRIEEKINLGFSCLKLKVGAIDFQQELALLKSIRQRFSSDDLELRVDANGAFSTDEALNKLSLLSQFDIHSIEQPIKAGQFEQMYQLCRKTPLPIALDEELIGISNILQKEHLISAIQPQYIILKPSLLGGWKASEEWINIAKNSNCGWWVTSALEANIGLSAIAQWTFMQDVSLRQGLGTGQVFSNNIESPLYLNGEELYYNPNFNWGNPFEQ